MEISKQYKAWGDLFSVPPSDITDIATFEQLFNSPYGDLLPLWGSCYKGNEKTIMDSQTLEVERLYHSIGICYKEASHYPSDHMSLLLYFGGLLTHLTIEYADNKAELVCWLTQTQRDLLDKHLIPLAENLFKKSQCLSENAVDSLATLTYYREKIEELITFLLSEGERLRNTIKALQSGTKDFTEISDEDKAYLRHLMMADSVINEAISEVFKCFKIDDSKECSSDFEPLQAMKQIPFAGINNCGGACSLLANVQAGKVIQIVNNDALSCANIKACVRGRGYRKTYLSHNRLKYPMRRVGERGEGKFKRISWDEAITLMLHENERIKNTYGAASRYVNYSTGNSGVIRGDKMVKHLLALDGGYLNYHNSYSTACISGATPYTFGDNEAGHSPDDYEHSKLIILWGHNPAATLFGPKTMKALIKAKEKGARIIVVDPRYTETAVALADQWVAIRPTTDSALADAIAYTMIQNNLHDRSFLDQYCVGYDADHMPEGISGEKSYQAYVMGEADGIPKTPKWAADITGIPEEEIIALAMAYATTKPAAILQGYGPQRHANGEQTVRSIQLLTCLTGNVGKRGGSSGGGSYKQHALPALTPDAPNPVEASIPCFLWTDAVMRAEEMTPAHHGLRGAEKLEQPIKMIWNLGGNVLVNQHSDINRTIRILKDSTKCEFIVCSNVFMTSSAMYADLVLPATSMFENENMKKSWGSDGSYLLYSQQVIQPLFEARFEYDWLKEMADRMGLLEAFTGGYTTLTEHLKGIYKGLQDLEPELPSFDEFKKAGGYVYKDNPTVIAYKNQIDDLSEYPFSTPSGKIELYSKALEAHGNELEIPAIPKYVPAFEGWDDPRRALYPYQLVGWHSKRRTHSIHDQNDWLEETEKQALWLNPDDAEILGIEEDDKVEMYNDRGVIILPVRLTRQMRRGVVGLSQGGWYTPDPLGKDRRGSFNVLSTSRPTPLIKGNPQHSNLVAIRIYKGEEGL
jgi:anaerobic dimethyl sulfoxide reductase subunit A